MFAKALVRAAVLICLTVAALPAVAQEATDAGEHQHHLDSSTAAEGWRWTSTARAFFGVNVQDRKFRDFTAWEAQNWVMGAGSRALGDGRLDLLGMVSLEPFTLHKIGSPQAFQTGETYRGAPLIDYQHPHDLLMGAGGTYRRPIGMFAVMGGVELVGSPTLGPTAYMHRASAAHNPEAPLSHHHLDSTHISPGVVRAGIGTHGLTLEASTFHGREPDEQRTDVDLGKLDSYAVRVAWARGPWRAQASGAQLTLPEAVTPYDAKRLTASVEYIGSATSRVRGVTGAFGQNREIHGNFEAYLLEAELGGWGSDVWYTRIESVAKDILDVGFHPRGFFHRHRQSQVGAFTIGYAHSLLRTAVGEFSVGGDVTGYAVPANLQDSYGRPWSVHTFLRYAFDSSATAAHVH